MENNNMDKSEYTKLLVCMIVMIAGIAVPYTGTAPMAIIFVGMIQCSNIADALIKLMRE